MSKQNIITNSEMLKYLALSRLLGAHVAILNRYYLFAWWKMSETVVIISINFSSVNCFVICGFLPIYLLVYS